jgi:translocation protein SEC63
LEVAPQALALNESFIAMGLAYSLMPPLLNALQTSQHIIQAVPPNASPLLQLPHFTPSIAKAIEGDSKQHMTIQQFMEMPEYQRRKLATDAPGTLSPGDYNEAVAVARQIPALHVERAFFKCLGEKHVITGSLVQFVVKARIIPPGTSNVPEVSPKDLEDIDPDEEDLDALLGRKPSKESRAKKADGTETKGEDEAPPLAFAPYFARDHSPKWSLFLADGRQSRVAVPPTSFTTFNKPIVDDEGKPTFHVQTLKLQFQAPPQANTYTFMMNLICDSYIGMDSRQEVTLVVEDPAKAVDIESDEEISEPDEGK